MKTSDIFNTASKVASTFSKLNYFNNAMPLNLPSVCHKFVNAYPSRTRSRSRTRSCEFFVEMVGVGTKEKTLRAGIK